MNFYKSFFSMSKGELLLYLALLDQQDIEKGYKKLNLSNGEKMGFKQTMFYDSRRRLIDRGILRKVSQDIYSFTPISK